ncbi:MAG: hypothetical protein WA110_06810 [Anaerolineaceae bacterium]
MQATKPNQTAIRVWVERFFIGIVLFLNLQAAIGYIFNPRTYLGSFELEGTPATAALAGTGILFAMWQVPYCFAVVNPVKYKTSLVEAVLMQAIGLIGETWLRTRIEPAHTILRGSLLRFIIFDAGGLVLLLIAFLLVHIGQSKTKSLE